MKWYYRIFLILPVFSLGALFFDEIRTQFMYCFPLATFSFFFIGVNFPSITKFTHQRPIYYNDVFMSIDPTKIPGVRFISKRKRKLFETFYVVSISLLQSIIFGLSTYNLINLIEVKEESFVHAFLDTGSQMYPVYRLGTMIIGKLVLSYLNSIKEQEIEDSRDEQIDQNLQHYTSSRRLIPKVESLPAFHPDDIQVHFSEKESV